MTISKVAKKRINLAIELLRELGMPKTQQNQRTGLCLLALLGLKPDTPVCDATNPLMGITPIMDFSYENYKVKYAPNSRETFRRFSIHNMMQAGLVVYNPDDDERPTNSPKAAYQVTPEFLSLIQQYGSTNWEKAVRDFKTSRTSLAEKYAKPRDLVRIPVKYADKDFLLSPGEHNELIQSIIENFASAFLHGAELLYVGDTQDKSAYFNDELSKSIKVHFDEHDKSPDVVFFVPEKNWLVLIESVTSHGPMDSKRFVELSKMFDSCDYDLVYVSAFRDRATFARYSSFIAWETEVWIEENPDHLIHFNGSKFLGPY